MLKHPQTISIVKCQFCNKFWLWLSLSGDCLIFASGAHMPPNMVLIWRHGSGFHHEQMKCHFYDYQSLLWWPLSFLLHFASACIYSLSYKTIEASLCWNTPKVSPFWNVSPSISSGCDCHCLATVLFYNGNPYTLKYIETQLRLPSRRWRTP